MKKSNVIKVQTLRARIGSRHYPFVTIKHMEDGSFVFIASGSEEQHLSAHSPMDQHVKDSKTNTNIGRWIEPMIERSIDFPWLSPNAFLVTTCPIKDLPELRSRNGSSTPEFIDILFEDPEQSLGIRMQLSNRLFRLDPNDFQLSIAHEKPDSLYVMNISIGKIPPTSPSARHYIYS